MQVLPSSSKKNGYFKIQYTLFVMRIATKKVRAILSAANNQSRTKKSKRNITCMEFYKLRCLSSFRVT